jgi:hypothetical protein
MQLRYLTVTYSSFQLKEMADFSQFRGHTSVINITRNAPSDAKITIENRLSPLTCFGPMSLRLLDSWQRFLFSLWQIDERARNEDHARGVNAVRDWLTIAEIERAAGIAEACLHQLTQPAPILIKTQCP